MSSTPPPVVENVDNDESVVLRNKQTKQSDITTVGQKSVDNGELELFKIDPKTRRSFINKSAYVKLHRSISVGNTKRHSVDCLKGKYENLQSNPEIVDDLKTRIQRQSATQLKEEVVDELKATLARHKPTPLPKPRHLIKQRAIQPKDENSNLIITEQRSNESRDETDDLSELEERVVVIRPSASEESIDKIAKELSNFTMDRKQKEKKRGSFRRLFSTSLFGGGKDKKKKDDDSKRGVYNENYENRREHLIYNDNLQNETNFNQQQPPSQQINGNYQQINDNHREKQPEQRQLTPEEFENIEKQYAERHINKFHQIRQNFAEPKRDYIPMDKPKKKPSISDYISAPVQRYIDTSSSTSSDIEKPHIRRHNSDNRHNTPPRASETYQNIKLIKPKATIPINSERSLPNPYQINDNNNPQTIERNLNKSNNKDYPDKKNDIDEQPQLNETYGTVFDSLEYITSGNGEMKPVNSPTTPKSPSSLEGSKLKLPQNREIYSLQPRVKSPLPTNRISTDKIIATELLRNSRSPTPQQRNVGGKSDEVIGKPPVSPKINNNCDTIVTNAMVHTPRSQTPAQFVELRQNNSVRSPTPNDLRMSANLKLSPQKDDIRKSVEEYYWKELKKMKEKEDYNLYMMQLSGYVDESARVRRSRSLSPSSQKYGRRSLSLPRDVRPVVPVKDYPDGVYGRLPPQPIPEDQALVLDARRKLNYEQNFIRNNPERRTIGGTNDGSLQRPIFRRGSLNKPPELYENQIYNKKVSFINNNNNNNANVKVWPTKNGYTQSPPQRRLDRRESFDDDVFLPTSQVQNYGYYNYVQNEPIYGNRGGLIQQQQQQQQQYDPRLQIGPRRLSMDSIPRPRQDIYVSRKQLQPPTISHSRPVHLPMKREIIIQDDIYGEFGGYKPQYLSNTQLTNQRTIANPLYASKQSIIDANLMNNQHNKQVTVTNKYCDIYGQIHDQVPRSGVLMGRLQNSPTVQQQLPQNFVRGTRLTASANDMGRRYYQQQQFDNIDDTNTNYDTRPLPPIPNNNINNNNSNNYNKKHPILPTGPSTISDTESGSDASEVRRIMQNKTKLTNNKKRGGIFDEEWNADGKSGRTASGNDSGRSDNESEVRSSSSRSRNTRRDDPRRHTLGGDQQYLGMAGQGGPLSRTMDLEGQPRGYPPPSNAMLFDDDPGIMSEVETSSTGFRRGGKQRSSLPVVRTPSKTLERPLGLVFLQYRNETKRALLPNEITSIDTVKALFVRSFPKQLTMEYLDSPNVKIYIHDSSKDMFYELEDLRSHLREIRDRSVLRLFESADVSGGLPMAGIGIAGGVGHFEDPSYFSEPEFDSEYQHQHIHKSKGSAGKGAPYYMGSTASLPRGAALLRTYSPAVAALPADRLKLLPTGAPPKPQRSYSGGSARSNDGPPRPPDRFVPFQRPANPLFNVPDGYMSSPERSSRYEDPYYSQYAPRSGSITPVIDEEISDTELLDESYSLYGVKLGPGVPRPAPRSPFPPPAAVPPYDATRLRVENMERQLANLTGLVQKALTQTPTTHLQVPGRDNYRTGDEFDKNSSSSSTSLPDDSYLRTDSKAPKLGKSGCHKSVSFEKSVSFSDEPPDMNSPKQHSPQHAADTKPAKPAIKSSTLPRTSSQERDRLKPAPPPKPASLSPGQYDGRLLYRDLQLTPEMYNQLRGLQKKAKDLRTEVRNLRRMSQAQAHSVRETIRDTFIKIRAMLLAGGEQVWQAGMDQERVRLSREEDLYKQEMLRLEKDLSDLESTVEELRGNVINRKTRVNMSDVENMALILSKSSKTVADLKLRFPGLQDSMKSFLSSEMEKVMREEKFLKEEPERLESALRRCKKLTGTLVTLKRLASVQEQRLPCSNPSADGRLSPTATETPPITPTSSQHSKSVAGARVGSLLVGGDSISTPSDSSQRPENALDALLDELQTFSKPTPPSQPQQQDLINIDQPPAIPAKTTGQQHHHHHHPPSMSEIGRKGSMDSATFLPTQNLTVSTATGSLRRLHSYPSGSDTDNSPPIQPLKAASGKPPLPERNTELLQHIVAGKRIPPPPPPRTSSKSPLASPTSPGLPPRCPAAGLQHIQNVQNMVENKPQSQFELATQNLGLSTLRRNVPNRSSIKDNKAQTLPRNIGSSNLQVPQENEQISASNSSSCESVNSQDGTKKTRKEELEQRHQELLKKQKALQEQYARLQQLQRGNNTLTVIPSTTDLLKKTGSESNLLQKMGLQMTTSQITGSLTNLPNTTANSITKNTLTNTTTSQNSQNKPNDNIIESEEKSEQSEQQNNQQQTTTNKVYETDIL